MQPTLVVFVLFCFVMFVFVLFWDVFFYLFRFFWKGGGGSCLLLFLLYAVFVLFLFCCMHVVFGVCSFVYETNRVTFTIAGPCSYELIVPFTVSQDLTIRAYPRYCRQSAVLYSAIDAGARQSSVISSSMHNLVDAGASKNGCSIARRFQIEANQS